MNKLIIFAALLIFCVAGAQSDRAESALTEFASMENGSCRFVIDTTMFKAEVTESLISNAKEIIFDKIKVLHQPIIGTASDSVYFLQIKSTNKKLTISRPLLLKAQKLYLVNDTTFYETFGMIYQICQRRENSSDLCEANVFSIEGKVGFVCGTDLKCVAPGTEAPCNSSKAVVLPDE